MFWIWHCPLVTQYKYPTATWGNMLLQWQVRIWSWGYKIKKLSVYSPPKACAPQLQVHIFLVLTSKQMKRSLDLVAFRNWCLAKLIVEQVNSRNSTFISSSNVSSRKAYLVLIHSSKHTRPYKRIGAFPQSILWFSYYFHHHNNNLNINFCIVIPLEYRISHIEEFS
jgi:hypothetical protein